MNKKNKPVLPSLGIDLGETVSQESWLVNNPFAKASQSLRAFFQMMGDEKNLGKLLHTESTLKIDARIQYLKKTAKLIKPNSLYHDVDGSKIYSQLYYDGKQLTNSDEIMQATISACNDLIGLHEKIPAILKKIKSIDKSDTEAYAKEVSGLIENGLGKNLIDAFKFDKQLKPLDKIEGCQKPSSLIHKVIKALGQDITRSNHQKELMKREKGIDSNAKELYVKLLTTIIDHYYTFLVSVSYWIIYSVRTQEQLSKEGFQFTLESEEEPIPEETIEETTETSSDVESSDDDESMDDLDMDEDTGDELGDEPSEETDEGTDAGMDAEDQEEDPREKAREIIAERRRAEAEESNDRTLERRPSGFSEPFDEKKQIVEYLEPLVGDQINEMNLVSAGDLNRPLYHISMNPNIKAFTPQVSNRTLEKENRSLPRISTSTSLIGCMNGYQSVMSDMSNRERKNFNGLYKVYQLPYQYAIQPSKKLLPDQHLSDEFWLISWKKETYSIAPTVVAEFTVPRIESTFGNNGTDYIYHLYVHVKEDKLYLDRNHVLQEGYYHVTLKGYDYNFPLKDNDKRVQVEVLDEARYRQVTSLSIMIKKKPSSEYK